MALRLSHKPIGIAFPGPMRGPSCISSLTASAKAMSRRWRNVQPRHAGSFTMLPGGTNCEGRSAPLIATLIIVPQLIVALLAPWIGQQAEKRGRKPIVLLGFAALPIRAMLFAMIRDPYVLIVTQILDGITGAALGVMTPLVIADVTKGTGRFNLAQGIFGAIMGVGASLSPTLTGLIVHRFGPPAGFVSLAAVGLVAFLVVAVLLPETKQDRKRDE